MNKSPKENKMLKQQLTDSDSETQFRSSFHSIQSKLEATETIIKDNETEQKEICFICHEENSINNMSENRLIYCKDCSKKEYKKRSTPMPSCPVCENYITKCKVSL